MKVAVILPLNQHVHALAFSDIVWELIAASRYVDSQPGAAEFRLCAGYRGGTAFSRTILGKQAYDSGAEWFLWMDDDQIPPTNCLQRLLATGKRFVSALYYVRHGNFPVCCFDWNNGEIGFLDVLSTPRGLHQVAFTGFGCLLMHRSVWEDVWNATGGVPFRTEAGMTEDVFFQHHAKKLGHIPWMDTRIEGGHLVTTVVRGSNRESLHAATLDAYKEVGMEALFSKPTAPVEAASAPADLAAAAPSSGA